MADPISNPGAAARQIVEQLRGLWARLPRLARLGGLAAIALVVVAIAWTALAPGGERWVAVSTTMSASDAAELSALLAGRGIPQRIAADGKGVEVPAARRAEAVLVASSAGLPRGGVGLELLEKSNFGQSSFGEQVTFVRALQGELARSIQSLAPVESARVHVALGRRSVFRDADEPPSASVVLRNRPGAHLTPDQVRGVKQLVAASVDGLAAARVAVVDQLGQVLLDADAAAQAGADAVAREVAIGQKVRGLLETIVGPGHVAVVVSVDMDRRKISETIETFDGANTAVRSTSTVGAVASPAATTGGIAGTTGNLPGAPAATGGATAGAPTGGSQTINYEVPRTVRQIEEAGDKIGRVHLAILVDHRPDASGRSAPLPADELAELAGVARAAAGLDERRGDELEISSLPFVPADVIAPPLPAIAPAEPLIPIPIPLPIAAGAGAALLGVVAVLIVALRRRRRRRVALPVLALPAPLGELERALADPSERAALPDRTDHRSLEERVVGAVRQDVPRAARVLSSWLSEPDPTASRA